MPSSGGKQGDRLVQFAFCNCYGIGGCSSISIYRCVHLTTQQCGMRSSLVSGLAVHNSAQQRAKPQLKSLTIVTFIKGNGP